MNPRVKDMWLTALRSGDYTQGVGALHTDVREWAGLATDDPVVTIEVEGWADEDTMIVHPTLSETNDDYGRSFPEIADIIEEQL